MFTGSKENVAHLLNEPNFELIRHDVVEPILLEIDQVYHLACPASPVHYKYNPIKTMKTGFIGTMNMLGLAKRCRARFLLTSTSEVYVTRRLTAKNIFYPPLHRFLRIYDLPRSLILTHAAVHFPAMETLWNTRRQRPTGATSIPSVNALVTTKESAQQSA